MRIVVQRVRSARVSVNDEVVGSIGNGLLLLVGIHKNDTEDDVNWLCEKVRKLRIFDDSNGKMNDSVEDVEGEILVVSQFTLYGDARKGNRPSYIEAAGPELAEDLYDKMIEYLQEHTELNIESGRFGAYMDVSLVNDGPVTILLDK